jgi:hypothetical protein
MNIELVSQKLLLGYIEICRDGLTGILSCVMETGKFKSFAVYMHTYKCTFLFMTSSPSR